MMVNGDYFWQEDNGEVHVNVSYHVSVFNILYLDSLIIQLMPFCLLDCAQTRLQK